MTRRIRSPGRARNKPLKPLRAGMPGDPGEPSVTTLVCFVLFRTRGCGCGGHPAFPTPSVFLGRMVHAQPGRSAPRECGVVSCRHCEEPTGRANARPMTGSATKQSTLSCLRHGLLRFARNDDLCALPRPACGERVGVRGTLHNSGFADSPPHPDRAGRCSASPERSDLSPQAGEVKSS